MWKHLHIEGYTDPQHACLLVPTVTSLGISREACRAGPAFTSLPGALWGELCVALWLRAAVRQIQLVLFFFVAAHSWAGLSRLSKLWGSEGVTLPGQPCFTGMMVLLL